MTKKEGPLVITAFEQYEWVEVTKEQLGERPLLVIFRRSMSTQMGHGQYFSAEEWANIVKVHNKRLWENTRYKCLKPAPKKEKPYPLDAGERKYLRAVLRPFKDNVDYVFVQKVSYPYNDKRSLYVMLKSPRFVSQLPPFNEGSMYNGLELNKNYKLEELGLWSNSK